MEEGRTAVWAAYDEMMRKFDLLPFDSPYRKTFLENIELHREILAAHTLRQGDASELG
jgi:hypothetical protein